MRAKFPKAKPKNYPRPPIGGTSRRIGHQRGSFGNGQHLRNRPGRILNEGAAARKDTTDNELLGIISKKIVGGVGAPKQNTLRIADKVIDYDNIGSKFINVVDEDSKFGKKPVQTKKHHAQGDAVYQLPPNKPAFVPTAEPWSKTVYGDALRAKSIHPNPSGQTYQGEPWYTDK